MKKKLPVYDPEQWHLWFAWYSVCTEDGYSVWWEKVWRKWNQSKDYDMDMYGYSHDVGGWDYMVDPANAPGNKPPTLGD